MSKHLAVVPEPTPEAPSQDDSARLAKMFAQHHASVWRVLRRLGWSPEAAADATQEAFLVAAGRLRDVNPDSERAFLVGTARRIAIAFGRKALRWQLDEDMDRRPTTARDAADVRDDVRLCDLVLSKVNQELAEVFVLYELEDMSSPEIASLLEIPLGTVASRLRRAREQFRAVAARLETTLRHQGRL